MKTIALFAAVSSVAWLVLKLADMLDRAKVKPDPYRDLNLANLEAWQHQNCAQIKNGQITINEVIPLVDEPIRTQLINGQMLVDGRLVAEDCRP